MPSEARDSGPFFHGTKADLLTQTAFDYDADDKFRIG